MTADVLKQKIIQNISVIVATVFSVKFKIKMFIKPFLNSLITYGLLTILQYLSNIHRYQRRVTCTESSNVTKACSLPGNESQRLFINITSFMSKAKVQESFPICYEKNYEHSRFLLVKRIILYLVSSNPLQAHYAMNTSKSPYKEILSSVQLSLNFLKSSANKTK